MFVQDKSTNIIYLSNRTKDAINVPASWMKTPADINIGTANPISKVASLSGLGNRTGLRVASSRPSVY